MPARRLVIVGGPPALHPSAQGTRNPRPTHGRVGPGAGPSSSRVWGRPDAGALRGRERCAAQQHFGEAMRHRSSRKFGMTRAISLVFVLLGSAAVFYSVYQVMAGHNTFSWVWLMSLLPAVYGAYLFGAYALKGHLPLPMPAEPAPDTEQAG